MASRHRFRPYNQKKKSPFVPSGYNYLGPWNRADEGPPTNYNDAVAQDHDRGYAALEAQGDYPKLQWSDADEDFLRDIKPDDVPTHLAKFLFEGKKKLHDTGLLGKKIMVHNKISPKKKKGALDKLFFDTTLQDRDREWLHEGDDPENAGDMEVIDDDEIMEEKAAAPGAMVVKDPGGPIVPFEPEAASAPSPAVKRTASGMEKTTQPDVGGTSARAAASGSNGAGAGFGETPVSPYPRITRNIFTETETVVLPLDVYFSFNALDKVTPVQLRIQMNCPYDILTGNTLVAQTINAPKTKGLSNSLSQDSNPNNFLTFGSGIHFPVTVGGATPKTSTTTSSGSITDGSAIPARRLWYQKIYDSYHTIACKYSIELEANSSLINSELMVFSQFDAVTASNTTQKIPVDAPYESYMRWPSIKKTPLGIRYAPGDDEKRHKAVISGTWMPNTVAKNTANSEDIKTWYPTGAAPFPVWKEELVLLAMAGGNSVNFKENCINCHVHLEYLVQFKDLKTNFRYPKSNDTAVNLQVPVDTLQRPVLPETVP